MPVTDKAKAHDEVDNPYSSDHNPTSFPCNWNNEHEPTSLIKELELPSTKLVKVPLGVFGSGMPEPKYCLEYNPSERQDTVGAEIMRTEEPGEGEYKLIYALQNFGSDSCTVRVWSCEEPNPKTKKKATSKTPARGGTDGCES